MLIIVYSSSMYVYSISFSNITYTFLVSNNNIKKIFYNTCKSVLNLNTIIENTEILLESLYPAYLI